MNKKKEPYIEQNKKELLNDYHKKHKYVILKKKQTRRYHHDNQKITQCKNKQTSIDIVCVKYDTTIFIFNRIHINKEQ